MFDLWDMFCILHGPLSACMPLLLYFQNKSANQTIVPDKLCQSIIFLSLMTIEYYGNIKLNLKYTHIECVQTNVGCL